MRAGVRVVDAATAVAAPVGSLEEEVVVEGVVVVVVVVRPPNDARGALIAAPERVALLGLLLLWSSSLTLEEE